MCWPLSIQYLWPVRLNQVQFIGLWTQSAVQEGPTELNGNFSPRSIEDFILMPKQSNGLSVIKLILVSILKSLPNSCIFPGRGYLKLTCVKAGGQLPLPKDSSLMWGFPLWFPTEGISPDGWNPSSSGLEWPTCLCFCHVWTFSSSTIAKETIPSYSIIETNKILTLKAYMPKFLLFLKVLWDSTPALLLQATLAAFWNYPIPCFLYTWAGGSLSCLQAGTNGIRAEELYWGNGGALLGGGGGITSHLETDPSSAFMEC